MRDLTLSDIERLRAQADEAEILLEMDEDAFRGFYDRTARVLHAYLSRVTGSRHLADDLLQETYYRFLRARSEYQSEAHRRNALFRIATNLAHDSHRRNRNMPVAAVADDTLPAATTDVADAAARSADLDRAMARLKPRERELIWLAYGQGSSHREIAGLLGLKTGSIKPLLFRARRKLADMLRGCAAQGKGHGRAL